MTAEEKYLLKNESFDEIDVNFLRLHSIIIHKSKLSDVLMNPSDFISYKGNNIARKIISDFKVYQLFQIKPGMYSPNPDEQKLSITNHLGIEHRISLEDTKHFLLVKDEIIIRTWWHYIKSSKDVYGDNEISKKGYELCRDSFINSGRTLLEKEKNANEWKKYTSQMVESKFLRRMNKILERKVMFEKIQT